MAAQAIDRHVLDQACVVQGIWFSGIHRIGITEEHARDRQPPHVRAHIEHHTPGRHLSRLQDRAKPQRVVAGAVPRPLFARNPPSQPACLGFLGPGSER
jgi:hypothetical protein